MKSLSRFQKWFLYTLLSTTLFVSCWGFVLNTVFSFDSHFSDWSTIFFRLDSLGEWTEPNRFLMTIIIFCPLWGFLCSHCDTNIMLIPCPGPSPLFVLGYQTTGFRAPEVNQRTIFIKLGVWGRATALNFLTATRSCWSGILLNWYLLQN